MGDLQLHTSWFLSFSLLKFHFKVIFVKWVFWLSTSTCLFFNLTCSFCLFTIILALQQLANFAIFLGEFSAMLCSPVLFKLPSFHTELCMTEFFSYCKLETITTTKMFSCGYIFCPHCWKYTCHYFLPCHFLLHCSSLITGVYKRFDWW